MKIKRIDIQKEIKSLQREIELECNEDLDILEICLTSKKECPCQKDNCNINLNRLYQKYKELKFLVRLYH